MQLKVAALMSEAEAAETPAEAPAAETAASAEEYQKHLEEGIGISILMYEVGSDCCSKGNTYMSKWSTNTGFQRELLNFGVRWLWGIDLDHSVYWIIHFATSLESLGVQEAQDREAEGEVSKQTAWQLNGCNLGSLAGLGVASWEHWTLRSGALRQRVENAAAEQTPSPSRLALMGSTFWCIRCWWKSVHLQ